MGNGGKLTKHIDGRIAEVLKLSAELGMSSFSDIERSLLLLPRIQEHVKLDEEQLLDYLAEEMTSAQTDLEHLLIRDVIKFVRHDQSDIDISFAPTFRHMRQWRQQQAERNKANDELHRQMVTKQQAEQKEFAEKLGISPDLLSKLRGGS